MLAQAIIYIMTILVIFASAEPPVSRGDIGYGLSYNPNGNGASGFGSYGSSRSDSYNPSSSFGSQLSPNSGGRFSSSNNGGNDGYGSQTGGGASGLNGAGTRYTASFDSNDYTGASFGGFGRNSFGNNGGSYGNGYDQGDSNGHGRENGEDDSLSEPANYEFSYEVDVPEYNQQFGHRESRQGDEAVGIYHVLLPDGRTQIVEYQADRDGYKPKISYREPSSSNNGLGTDGDGIVNNGAGDGRGVYDNGAESGRGGYDNGAESGRGGYDNFSGHSSSGFGDSNSYGESNSNGY